MEPPASIALLEQLRFSADLPADVLARVAAIATVSTYPAGSTLFREGTLNDRLLIVTSGRVALDMRVPGRGEVRVLSLGPGDVVAWSALIGDGCMTTSAVALDDVQLVSVGARDLLALCESDHTLGFHLMRQLGLALANRLVATRLQLLDLFAETSAKMPLASH
ncbi:MAG: cyclic nucleotide-binding domain-containing protein [Pirellulales bacterium]